VPLSRITHSDVSSWVHGLTDEGPAPATARYAHRVLSLALTAAVRDGRLVRNVAKGVPLPRVVATPKRFLTHDQVQALAEACPPYDVWCLPPYRAGCCANTNFRPRFFDPAAEKVGLLGLTPHERRTAASLALAAGANVKAVRQILGHALRRYDPRHLCGPLRR
jgi:integrase